MKKAYDLDQGQLGRFITWTFVAATGGRFCWYFLYNIVCQGGDTRENSLCIITYYTITINTII